MKKFFSTLLISSLLFSSSFASDKIFVVNPEAIRGQLFSGNITLREALNNVESSKLNMSMARAKLLPSLNLGVLLPALANPTFLLSSVTFLFPFLVPSNWAVLKQQNELFEADKASYKALQLNILSNALSLYYTYLNDQKIQNIYVDQSEALGKIYSSLKKQSDVLGNVTSEDLGMASAQWEESKIRISKLQELLIAEKAGIRQLLGLPLGSELSVEDSEVLPSQYENKSAGEIADRSKDIAPEALQLSYVLKAAIAGKFAKLFGFLSAATLSGTSTNNNSPFDGLKASGGFSFGLDNLVNIKIANNNIEAVKLRQEQFDQENEKMAEILAGQIQEGKQQEDLASLALSDRLNVYEGQKRQYALGLISLQTLLQTETLLTDSKVNKLKTDLDLKMQRITLKRMVIEGEFGEVKGCNAEFSQDKKGLFHFKKERSLDQLCQN
ncbi:MAG: TolC family protein [Bacteriovorax sp.]